MGRKTMTRAPRRAVNTERESVGRMAVGVDPAAKSASLLQVRRARGQVEGIERMIREDRGCADVIVQITAARASLLAVAKSLLNEHLKTCSAAVINNGGQAADGMYRELVELVSKMAR